MTGNTDGCHYTQYLSLGPRATSGGQAAASSSQNPISRTQSAALGSSDEAVLGRTGTCAVEKSKEWRFATQNGRRVVQRYREW